MKKINIYLNCTSTKTAENTLFLPIPIAEVLTVEIENEKIEEFVGLITTQKWVSIKINNGHKLVNTSYILYFDILD